jgi:ATP-binding cassette subfamily B protein
MNIIFYLFSQFLIEEKFSTAIIILSSFIISILQSGGISFTTAKILKSIQKYEEKTVWEFFKYFMLISVFYISMNAVYKQYQNKFLTRLRQWIRGNLVKMLLKINNEEFSDINFAQLNAPINRVSSISYIFLNDIITYVLPYATFVIIICMYFCYKNLLFGLGFIIGNICLISYCFLNIDELVKYNNKYEKIVVENESYLIDILNNMDKIVYRGEIDNEIKTFWTRSDNAIEAAYDLFKIENYHQFIANIIIYIILFISIACLTILTLDKKIEITIYLTFFTILLLYKEKMGTLLQQVPSYIEFIGRADSVLQYFKNTEKDYLKTQKIQYKKHELEWNSIQFKDVSFEYKSSDKKIFEHKNVLLYTNNKIIGITGLSGNGKSTFAKLLLKMYKPSNGHILIDNINVNEIDTDYIRKNITYVNQNSKLFDMKILDNILYGCNNKEVCYEHLEEIMKYKKIKELYKNLDFESKQPGYQGENLSGGQRQVINLIGGLVNPSKILILDEPTNALDPALKKEMLNLILDFKKHKKCIIIITHDKDVFPLFNESITF